MPEESCLFCRIIAGEIPGEIVHQDERCVVIRDNNPQAPTHVLVIPREHLESLDDASQKDEVLLGHLLLEITGVGVDEAGLVSAPGAEAEHLLIERPGQRQNQKKRGDENGPGV